jgi:hypothetical protein
MKTLKDNAGAAIPELATTGAALDMYLEVEPLGHNGSSRLPVQVKDLADEGVILEVADFPNGFDGEALLQQPAVIHLAPDGVTKETQLPSKVVWVRQGENGTSHYLLGLDLGEADFRARRVLKKFVSRPKDMADLWTYWDQAQPKPAEPAAPTNDSKIIFFLGAGVSVAGVALKVTLPSSYDVMAMTLVLVGIYMIAGKCLWNWWRGRTVPKEG